MLPLMVLRTLFATKLGACGFCIRLSLLLSVVSCVLAIGIGRLFPSSALAALAFAPAIGLTALFTAHLVAFIVRVTLGYHRMNRAVTAEGPDLSVARRRFLGTSLRVLGLALLPTVIASAVQGSTRGPCDRSSGCDPSTCCCHNCKTRLKACDPNYSICVSVCILQCLIY